MPYESDNYLSLLIASVLIAIVKYCAFPVIFANARKKPIERKKYKLICWGVNAGLWFITSIFAFMSTGKVGAGAFILWTLVFVKVGTSQLEKRGILIPEEEKIMCPRCGYQMAKDCLFCKKCGQKMPEPEPEPEAEVEEQPTEENSK